MKTKLFKIMFTFAAVMLLTAVLAVTASAEIINGDCGAEGYSLPYVLDTETGVLRITGRGVMVDYAPWYSYRSDIKTITIEKGVKSIGSDAFAFFENLTSVTIPDSVTSIGDSTFSHCESLTDVTIPDSVTSIGDFAFSCCKSLTDVTIPDSVTSIGFRAFVACDNLIEIKVDENNANYCDVDGVLFNKDKTEIIAFPVGNGLVTYVVPDSVTSIGDYAFYCCKSLTDLTIPDSVTSIGSEAFHTTGLRSVTIPKSVTRIEDSLFGISDIYYGGSIIDWYSIDTGEDNSYLAFANVHFNCEKAIDIMSTAFDSAEDRIEKMRLYNTVDGMEFYCDSYSGEVAVKDTISGQIFLSNPYSVGASNESIGRKKEMLSQLIIKYTDEGVQKTFTSFEEASMREQVSVDKIENGIKVEYAIGNDPSRLLVPKMISKDRFQTEILDKIVNSEARKFLEDFYSLKDPSAVDKKVLKEAIYQRWPITKEMAIYVLPTDGNGAVSYKEQLLIDNIIKNSCPDYTFEDLEYDHALTQYEGADISNIETANFKLSLEYTYEKDRLTATLSEDGVSYDEKLYVLDEITILPYNSGYTLLSDGSGAMVEFEGRDIPQDKTNIDTGDNSEITNTQSNAPILIAVIFGIIIFFFIVIIILLFLLIRKKIKVKR